MSFALARGHAFLLALHFDKIRVLSKLHERYFVFYRQNDYLITSV